MATKGTEKAHLSSLPSVDELLRSEAGKRAVAEIGAPAAASLARTVIETLRGRIVSLPDSKRSALADEAQAMLSQRLRADKASGIRRVINATGVVIHTNLGRAPLADSARRALIDASAYATVEYDVLEGRRGRRGARAEKLAAELCGAEDAVIVNNCAAAAFFVLTVFAAGGEVVISRGELVEIGGDFRVPDVLAASGSVLREVGTTNRTKVADYERAINSETRMLLRVHPSNYRVVGFTSAPSRAELARLAAANNLIFFEDAGSGALVDLSAYGLKDEPVISEIVRDGAHLVSFSGDKLLGGPQCGIIAGDRELVEKLRKHPLQRALRADKKTYASLEATLDIYRRGTPFTDIPVLRQIAAGYDEMLARAEALKARMTGELSAEIIEGSSVIGGGAAPDVHPRTALLALRSASQTPEQIERRLRMNSTPIIARIDEGRVVLDLRTVEPGDEDTIVAALNA